MTWPTYSIGKVILSSQYGLSIPAHSEGHIPMVGMKGIQGGRVHIDDTICVSLSDEELDTYKIRKGDILLNRTNSPDLVGKTGLALEDMDAVFASYLVRIMIDKSKADPEFINYCMNSEAGQRQMKTLSTRAISQANINPTTFKQHFRIPLPPIAVQHEIAAILRSWDTAVDKIERLIAAKEKSFSWLINSYIADQCRHWEHLHAENIFESISEKKNNHEELLSVTQDRGVIPRTMLEGRVMSPQGSTDGYKLVKQGDFVISLRSFQGGIEYSRYQGLISPAYTVLRRRMEIHDEFYRHFFKSYIFIEKYLSIAVIGIRDGKQISAPDFMTVKIPCPPFAQQKEISNILDTARQEIDFLQRQLAAYRKQKRGLMQKLLTGEWQVKTAAEVS